MKIFLVPSYSACLVYGGAAEGEVRRRANCLCETEIHMEYKQKPSAYILFCCDLFVHVFLLVLASFLRLSRTLSLSFCSCITSSHGSGQSGCEGYL